MYHLRFSKTSYRISASTWRWCIDIAIKHLSVNLCIRFHHRIVCCNRFLAKPPRTKDKKLVPGTGSKIMSLQSSPLVECGKLESLQALFALVVLYAAIHIVPKIQSPISNSIASNHNLFPAAEINHDLSASARRMLMPAIECGWVQSHHLLSFTVNSRLYGINTG